MTTAQPTESNSETRVRLYGAGSGPLRASVLLGWGRALLGAGAILVIGSTIDTALAGGRATEGLIWLAILLGLRAVLTVPAPPLATSAAVRVEADLRRRLVDAVLEAGPWSGRRTGGTMIQATEGVEAVGALAGTFLPQLIAGMSTPILLAIVVAVVDWLAALVLIAILPLIPILLRLLEKRFASVSANYRETADQLAARFLDGIQGLRTLKALDYAERYGDEIADEAERLRVETMRLLRVNQLALLAVDTLFTLGTVVAAAVIAAIRLEAAAITSGEAVAIVLLGVMLIEPLSQIGRFFYVGAIGRAAAKQIEALLAATDQSGLPPVPSGSQPGVVSFQDVSFSYPDGTPAIRDISFQITPGESVAVIGPSGSGKTTLAHLVLGLISPQEGMVEVGGRAVLVPQRPYVFRGTVAENLRLASPGATDAQLWEALAAAELDGTFRARSDGLDTPIGERGLDLSGGEVQRLAIARAFLVDAAVIVLDEPTSNVDLESEARIRSATEKLTRDRTLLVIAHRRSTVAGVDRVLVLDRGRLTADTSSSELSAHLVGSTEEKS